jgi:transcriptional regulator with XRE-family HTH domain
MTHKLTLKSARQIKGLTQEEAAKSIGISVETLQNYEKGKSFPTILTLKKIEDVYQVSYNDLIFLQDNHG